MPRALNGTLDALQQEAERREPGFILEVYDIRSTSTNATPTTINDVVLSNVSVAPPVLPAIVGPRDFTDDVIEVTVNEVAGDYLDQGVASSAIAFVASDPSGELDPVGNPAPSDGRWLRQGNVVVLREGDQQVDSSLWPITFTGSIVGQPGQDRNRTTGRSRLTVKCSDRMADFLRRNLTTENFPQNTAYSDMVDSIARNDMGLDAEEINLPSFGSRTTCHVSTQLVEQNPISSIAQVMFPDGFMPRFEGDGRLGLTNGIITKSPARVYQNDELIVEVQRPIVEENGTNVVIVIGLGCDKEQVTQDRQDLVRVGITTGFYAQDTTIPVNWSDDRTQQAVGAKFEVDVSINDGLFNVGSESFTATVDSDGGSRGGVIEVESGFSLWLIAAIAVSWVASHAIPDGATLGSTIPVGRLVEGAVGELIMNTLSSQGRGEYRITGQPYEYVFPEIRAEARVANVRSEDRREQTIENHLVNDQSDGDTIAMTMLRRERAKQNQRTVRSIHDLVVVPDDIIELSDGSRIYVQSVSRTLRRQGQHVADLAGFEVTEGVRP